MRSHLGPRPLIAVLLLVLAALPAVAQEEPPPGSGPFLASYLEQARETADRNRFLVKTTAADGLIVPATNMEPRMVHCDELAATFSKLADAGYCPPALPQTVLDQCSLDVPQPASCKRPNILIFLVDDMGWSDFGPYGGGVAVGAATPSVDKIASQGLVLTSTYAQPSCSPTRATIHTGQLPVHHGVLSPPMYGAPGGLTASSFPLPMILKNQGYVTRGAGKWHLGNGQDNLPSTLGYDEFLGFLNVSDMYSEWRDHYYNPEVRWDGERTGYMQTNQFNHYLVLDSAKEGGCANLAEIVLPEEARVADRGEDDWGFGGPCAVPQTPKRKVSIGELDQIWADYSVKFIEESEGSDQPWFLYHATRGCHFDNYPREDFERASYARTIYGDCTVEIDEVFGRLMAALEETGQDQDTLVFFTSDNGPEAEVPPHGHTPFRGAKGDTWEGGVRVPGIAYWPGMIEGGQRSDGLFDLADLYSTVISLAGFDYAADREQDDRYLYGIDQSSFLLTDGGQSNRRSVLYWYSTNFAAVRMDEFKAHRMTTQPVGLHRGNIGGFSGVNLPSSYLLMFNLMVDPQEQDNVMIRHLWNNALFGREFRRYYCILTRFEPYLPTELAENILIDNSIGTLLADPQFRQGCRQMTDS